MNYIQQKKLPSHCHINEIMDSLSIKLAQARTLLLIGSDVDFSNYHSSVQQDFFGVTLEYVEDICGLIEGSVEQS